MSGAHLHEASWEAVQPRTPSNLLELPCTSAHHARAEDLARDSCIVAVLQALSRPSFILDLKTYQNLIILLNCISRRAFCTANDGNADTQSSLIFCLNARTNQPGRKPTVAPPYICYYVASRTELNRIVDLYMVDGMLYTGLPVPESKMAMSSRQSISCEVHEDGIRIFTRNSRELLVTDVRPKDINAWLSYVLTIYHFHYQSEYWCQLVKKGVVAQGRDLGLCSSSEKSGPKYAQDLPCVRQSTGIYQMLGQDTSCLQSQDDGFHDIYDRNVQNVRLNSFAQSLASCNYWSLAAHDIVESHVILFEKGVSHREPSWTNLLLSSGCHLANNTGENEQLGGAAIAAKADINLDSEPQRLGVKLVNERLYDHEPCAMTVDFDHAVQSEGQDKSSKCKRWTGTPMFIACELAYPRAIIQYDTTLFPWDDLTEGLEALDNSVAALRASGLDKDETFMLSFRLVKDKEVARRHKAKKDRTLRLVNATRFHEWLHDCESVFWCLLWGVSLSHPRHAWMFDPDTDNGYYSLFCRYMLGHVVGDQTTEAARTMYLNPCMLGHIWHPAFARIEQLFMDMAAYISVPWFLYRNDAEIGLKENHVFVAFQRLILAWALQEDLSFMDVPLTIGPCSRHDSDADVTPRQGLKRCLDEQEQERPTKRVRLNRRPIEIALSYSAFPVADIVSHCSSFFSWHIMPTQDVIIN